MMRALFYTVVCLLGN